MSRVVPISKEEKKKIFDFASRVIRDAEENESSRWKLSRRYSVYSMCIGTVGEYGYGKMTGQKVNLTVKSKGDKGIDFPDGAQVKTVTYNGPDKELKVSNLSSPKKPKKYVLAYYDKSNKSDFVVMIGEISYESFLNKNKVKYYNGRLTYIVDEKDLDKLYT